MDALSIALVAVSGVLLVMVILLVIYVVRLQKKAVEQASRTEEIVDALDSANKALSDTKAVLGAIQDGQIASSAAEQQRFDAITREFTQSGARMDALRRETSEQLDKNRENIEQRLDSVRQTVNKQLGDIRSDNNKQLEEMRTTVDEKLSKTINDRLSASFETVTKQLDMVSRGLGEMQQVATGVGDLKRVLANVKTRGNLGEIQLAAILSEILSPEQYDTDVATVPNSDKRVEFAIKIPTAEGEFYYLPVDSKFPGDTYEHLRDALDTCDKDTIKRAYSKLETQIKNEAKDIHDKYIAPPTTTTYGIMFLPFEGLYSEVVNRPGLVQTLVHDYQITVAGPSTMAAILNSLQMTYQTIGMQKRTGEVLKVLQSVKAELPEYQKALERARKQITTADNTVDELITTRTNVLQEKLEGVDTFGEANEVASIPDENALALPAEDVSATSSDAPELIADEPIIDPDSINIE